MILEVLHSIGVRWLRLIRGDHRTWPSVHRERRRNIGFKPPIQCGRYFIGEKEAIKQAKAKGHTPFGHIPAEEDG